MPVIPVCEAEAVGVAAFLKLMILPFTFRVEPSWIRAPTVVALVVRWATTVVLPPPVAVVRPIDLRKSAAPVTLRSAPVELLRVTAPPPETDDAVWPALVANAATPAVTVFFFTPLARSIAVSTSPSVAVVVVLLVPR